MENLEKTLSNVQGGLLRGSSSWTRARYLFFRFRIEDPGSAADALGRLKGLLVDATTKDDVSPFNVNVALTYRGLEVLGVDYDGEHRYTGDFRKPRGRGRILDAFAAGMREADLGDVWPDDPGNEDWWSADWSNLEPHLMVWIRAEEDHLDAITARAVVAADGLVELGRQEAAALTDAREHFGFKDGVSQPSIRGVKPGLGKIAARGWTPLELGEFILGHRDEGWQTLPLPEPYNVTKDGTFLVYRKLYQDVAAFNRFIDRNQQAFQEARSPGDPARKLVGEDADLGAKIMGRTRNGDPLIPATPGASGVAPNNDYRYQDDPDGYGCPVGSHVRRANPRDALLFQGRLVNRHRIIRQGMPYGDPFVVGKNEGDDRGLIFIAINARIEDQFEFIQTQWLNAGRPFHLGDEPDPIAGNGGVCRVVVNGVPPFLAKVDEPFVEFRGGEYFFVPSFSGLDAIMEAAEQRAELSRW